MYDLSIRNNIPRKGDDSLLSLVIGYYSKLCVKYLTKSYNLILSTKSDSYFVDGEIIQTCIFCHLLKRKPWNLYENYPTHTFKYFIDKWRKIMFDNFTRAEIKEFYPQF